MSGTTNNPEAAGISVELHTSTDLVLSEAEDARLNKLLAELKKEQPTMVVQALEQAEVGWDSSGFPDTSGVAEAEQTVKRKICMILVIETAKFLNVNLGNEEISHIIISEGYIYDNIIEATVKYVNDKLKKSKVSGTE